MAIVSMAQAVARTTASSAEYNKLIANINDLDGRLGPVVSTSTAAARLATLESATANGTTGNAALGTRTTKLEAAKPTITKVHMDNSTVLVVNSTTEAQIMSYTFNVTTAASQVGVAANFDVAATGGLSGVDPAGGGCCVVKCYLDGVVQDAQIIFGSTALTRLTAGQSWAFSNLSVGSHTLVMKGVLATKPTSNPTYNITGQHTGLTITISNQ